MEPVASNRMGTNWWSAGVCVCMCVCVCVCLIIVLFHMWLRDRSLQILSGKDTFTDAVVLEVQDLSGEKRIN